MHVNVCPSNTGRSEPQGYRGRPSPPNMRAPAYNRDNAAKATGTYICNFFAPYLFANLLTYS